jgi:2-polyprenyl-3-methyl-5-hydroxy-6-metoxy-1,4-benzoquinol methylase
VMNVSEFFDELYRNESRYWWRDKERYATDAESYPFSLLTQMTLRLIQSRRPGRALDLGAGEGADAIRLALMGYSVDAVELSGVAAKKIEMFAAEAGAIINVQVADISTYEPTGQFDVIICNGVLQYIDDKAVVVDRMQNATAIGGINVISLWSTFTTVPDCHAIVPIYCDDEDGVVVKFYQGWKKELLYFERDKPEMSHFGMPPHLHSHIKLIATKTLGP